MTTRWFASARRREEEFARLVEGGRAASSSTVPTTSSVPTTPRSSSGPISLDPELLKLAGLAQSLRPAALGPSEDFRVALRARLLATPMPVAAPARPRVARVAPVRVGGAARRWATVTAGTAGLVLAATGTAAASGGAVPGEALYGVKRGLEGAQLALERSDFGKGKRHLEAADTRLTEVGQLLPLAQTADGEVVADAGGALADQREAAREGTRLLLLAAAETNEPYALRILDEFLDREQADMVAMHGKVPAALAAQWGPSVAFLGELEQQVEHVEACAPACLPADPQLPPLPPIPVVGASPSPSPTPSSSLTPVPGAPVPTPAPSGSLAPGQVVPGPDVSPVPGGEAPDPAVPPPDGTANPGPTSASTAGPTSGPDPTDAPNPTSPPEQTTRPTPPPPSEEPEPSAPPQPEPTRSGENRPGPSSPATSARPEPTGAPPTGSSVTGDPGRAGGPSASAGPTVSGPAGAATVSAATATTATLRTSPTSATTGPATPSSPAASPSS